MSEKWRDLAEAAEWLERETGKAWSARDVLRAVISSANEGNRYMPISFSAGDACIRGELFAPKAEQAPSYFVPGTLLSLGARQADEILAIGATRQAGGELYGRPDYRWLCVPSIEVGLVDLLIAEQALLGLVSEPAADSNEGGRLRWTDERKAEARAMRDRLKNEGARDYAKQTAEHFGVSPTRLRVILAEGDTPSPWPAFKRP